MKTVSPKSKGKDTLALCRVDLHVHAPRVGAQSGKDNGRVLIRDPKNGLTTLCDGRFSPCRPWRHAKDLTILLLTTGGEWIKKYADRHNKDWSNWQVEAGSYRDLVKFDSGLALVVVIDEGVDRGSYR
jgi:hypothetical protein